MAVELSVSAVRKIFHFYMCAPSVENGLAPVACLHGFFAPLQDRHFFILSHVALKFKLRTCSSEL